MIGYSLIDNQFGSSYFQKPISRLRLQGSPSNFITSFKSQYIWILNVFIVIFGWTIQKMSHCFVANFSISNGSVIILLILNERRYIFVQWNYQKLFVARFNLIWLIIFFYQLSLYMCAFCIIIHDGLFKLVHWG